MRDLWIATLLEEAEYYFSINEIESSQQILDQVNKYRHLMDLEATNRANSLQIEIDYKTYYE